MKLIFSGWCGILILSVLVVSEAGAQSASDQSPARKRSTRISPKNLISKLKSLDEPLAEVQPGDWLASQREPGQTFLNYTRIRPVVLTRERSVLYVQPLGEAGDIEKQLMRDTAEYLQYFYGCRVKMLDPLPADTIPESAQRIAPTSGETQWNTGYLLEKVLTPRLPDDGFAVIGLTNRDLWPGEGWNFVFGYASFRNRVGVWSIHRMGQPEQGAEAYRECLRRTIHLAVHETGHMFSMMHCTRAQCLMQGSNSLAETDRQPMHLCSHCLAKTCFATGADPVERMERLKKLCQKHGLEDEARHYSEALERLR